MDTQDKKEPEFADVIDTQKAVGQAGKSKTVSDAIGKMLKNDRAFDEAEEAEFKDIPTKKEKPKTKKSKIKFTDIPPDSPSTIRPKNKQKKGGSFTPVLALLVAVASAGGLYYHEMEMKALSSGMQSTAADLNSSVADITDRLNASAVKSGKNNKAISGNSDRIDNIQNQMHELKSIPAEIKSIVADMNRIDAELVKTNAKINASMQSLESYINKADMLKRRAPTKKTKAVKSDSVSSTVGEAVLSSIDRWGGSINAMLKTQTGWVALAVGDMYQGWRFDSAQDDTALFVKGKRKLRLRVKE